MKSERFSSKESEIKQFIITTLLIAAVLPAAAGTGKQTVTVYTWDGFIWKVGTAIPGLAVYPEVDYDARLKTYSHLSAISDNMDAIIAQGLSAVPSCPDIPVEDKKKQAALYRKLPEMC